MSVTSFRRRCRSLLSTLCASASWRFSVPASARRATSSSSARLRPCSAACCARCAELQRGERRVCVRSEGSKAHACLCMRHKRIAAAGAKPNPATYNQDYLRTSAALPSPRPAAAAPLCCWPPQPLPAAAAWPLQKHRRQVALSATSKGRRKRRLPHASLIHALAASSLVPP